MQASRSSYTRLPLIVLVLMIAISYFVLAKVSLLFSFETSNATPVWPPSGFAFAMILVLGNRIAPGILLGAFAANLVVFQANHTADLPHTLLSSFIISIGNTGEALVGNFLLKRVIGKTIRDNYFRKVNHIFKFSMVALIMCLVSSITGSSVVYASGIIPESLLGTVWLTWWLGDFSGVMLVTPFLLIWLDYFHLRRDKNKQEKKSRISILEDIVLFGLAILVTGIVFDNWFFNGFIFNWAFWVIPIVVWSALRFNQHETVSAVVLCSVLAIWGTIHRHGPFADLTFNYALLVVQSFISIIVVTALALHASIIERNDVELQLRLAGEQLDKRVSERTSELEERNLFIETIFDSVESLMAVFDTKGNFLSVNKKVESIYKMNRDEIIGKNLLDLFPEVRTSGMYENLEKAVRGEMVHHLSYRSVVSQRFFENFYIPLKNHKHEVYGVLVIGHDITPVMEAAEKVEEINTKLNEAQRLAHIGSWQWDITRNHITWSDELYRIFGLDKDTFEGNYEMYLQHIHPDDRELANNTIQQAYAAKQPFDFYHRVIRPDGQQRVLHGRGEVILNEKQEPIGMRGTAQDVTEIKHAEEEIKQMANELIRYNKELEQTNKELESFTFVASHDLQEPLRKIRTFLTLISEKELVSLSAQSKDYMMRTIRAAEQMQQLIIDLLTYSRTTGSDEHLKKTDLNETLEKVKNDLRELIEEKDAVIDADPLPTLDVIPFQFQQLFTNLLSNSLKFSKPGVRPEITIRHMVTDEVQFFSGNGDAKKLYHSISIADNGIGFESKYNEKIFGLFQRLNSKQVYNGTGIGLSICKKIVDNHGGVIIASGENGKGATIQFYIPEAN